MQTFTLPKGVRNLSRIVAFMSALSSSVEWEVIVQQKRRKRSNDQNAYLWGVVYAEIIKHLPGWTADDVHEFFLGEHFGWELLEGLGRKRMRPIRRSSKLSTIEFQDFIAFIQRSMAERGIYIEDPNEQHDQQAA